MALCYSGISLFSLCEKITTLEEISILPPAAPSCGDEESSSLYRVFSLTALYCCCAAEMFLNPCSSHFSCENLSFSASQGPLSPHYLSQGRGQQAGSGEAASFSASHKVARMKLASSSRSSMLKAMGLNTNIDTKQHSELQMLWEVTQIRGFSLRN